MCDSNVGVAKRIDLQSVSEDVAALLKKLDKEAAGEISVHEIKKIEKKLGDIIRK